jgi:hypothetical protein
MFSYISIRSVLSKVHGCRLALGIGEVGKHEREESNPVRQFWRLAALPGAHSCNLGCRLSAIS